MIDFIKNPTPEQAIRNKDNLHRRMNFYKPPTEKTEEEKYKEESALLAKEKAEFEAMKAKAAEENNETEEKVKNEPRRNSRKRSS